LIEFVRLTDLWMTGLVNGQQWKALGSEAKDAMIRSSMQLSIASRNVHGLASPAWATIWSPASIHEERGALVKKRATARRKLMTSFMRDPFTDNPL